VCTRGSDRAPACGPSTSPLGLGMRPTPSHSALRKWPLWFGVAAVGEVAWFALLHPLVPRTLRAAFVLALVPLPLAGYAYVVVRLLLRLADAQWNLRLRQAMSLVLAVSVGCFGFVLLWITETHFNAEVGYFWLQRQ
jgi:hypothetical protein